MDTQNPPKTNFQRLATSSTIFLLVTAAIAVGTVVFLKWREAGSHDFTTDHVRWQRSQAVAERHNAFWLTLAGRMKPTDQKDTLLASDLHNTLIQPAIDAEGQAQSVMRLANRSTIHASYGPISENIKEELGWPWGENPPPQSFLRNVELVRTGKTDGVLQELAPEPRRDDPKYAFDMKAEVKKVFNYERILGLYLILACLTALSCGLFRSRGWWRWDPEDAVFKIWLVILLAPVVAIWAACIILWAAFSIPVKTCELGRARACSWLESRKLANHPHREHIYTLDWVIDELEREIAKANRTGHNTRELEDALAEARRVRDEFLGLPKAASTLEGIRHVIDNSKALIQALQELDGSGPPVSR